MASLFKRQQKDPEEQPRSSRKVSLGTRELDYLTANTELKDREMLRFHFDNFIARYPKGCITRQGFREMARHCYPSKNYQKIEKRLFNLYDKNGDGSISFREFMTVMYIMSSGTPEENLRQIFRA